MFSDLQSGKGQIQRARLDPAGALWLLWRRSQGRPVLASWVALNVEGTSVARIENFFSKKYGIKGIEPSRLDLPAICGVLGVDTMSQTAAEKMIEEMEERYGEIAQGCWASSREVNL